MGDNIQEISILHADFFGFEDYLRFHINNYVRSNPNLRFRLEAVKGDIAAIETKMLADATSWDGAIFPSQITGSLVEANVLWDLSEFVSQSRELEWDSVLPFYRNRLSYFDRKVRMIPLDGDILVMYYRKDLFEEHNIQVPRTWGEYTEAAQYFQGKMLGTNNSTLYGSCVSRIDMCGNSYWASLVLSSMTQTSGTASGYILDPRNLDLLLGDALDEALRHLSDQMRFGHPNELKDACLSTNFDLLNECAMTYNWASQMLALRDLPDGVEVGVAQTPGSTKYYDRETRRLLDCDKDSCPFGNDIDGLGLVNRAPYSAFGGWGGGVSNAADPGTQRAVADFLAYISNSAQSLQDVLPNQRSKFAQPYRDEHVQARVWSDVGYDSMLATEFTQAVQGINSPNSVLELRVPWAYAIRGKIDAGVYDFLQKIRGIEVTDERTALRKAAVRQIRSDLRAVVDTATQQFDTAPLESYQRSLGVFMSPSLDKNYINDSFRSAGWGLSAGICCASLFFLVLVATGSRHRVVRAWQRFVLIQACVGLFLMGGTIPLLSLDDSIVSSTEGLDVICQLSPWLYVIGFSVFFAPLYQKIRRCREMYKEQTSDRTLEISSSSSNRLSIRLLLLNSVFLAIWTGSDPLRWERIDLHDPSPGDAFLPDTYGACRGETVFGSIVFPAILFALNMAFCFVGVLHGLKYRNTKLEFKESQWLPLAFLPSFVGWLIGAPFLFLVETDPSGTFVLLTIAISVSCIGALLALFAPLEWYIRKYNKLDESGMKRRASYFRDSDAEMALRSVDGGKDSRSLDIDTEDSQGSVYIEDAERAAPPPAVAMRSEDNTDSSYNPSEPSTMEAPSDEERSRLGADRTPHFGLLVSQTLLGDEPMEDSEDEGDIGAFHGSVHSDSEQDASRSPPPVSSAAGVDSGCHSDSELSLEQMSGGETPESDPAKGECGDGQVDHTERSVEPRNTIEKQREMAVVSPGSSLDDRDNTQVEDLALLGAGAALLGLASTVSESESSSADIADAVMEDEEAQVDIVAVSNDVTDNPEPQDANNDDSDSDSYDALQTALMSDDLEALESKATNLAASIKSKQSYQAATADQQPDSQPTASLAITGPLVKKHAANTDSSEIDVDHATLPEAGESSAAEVRNIHSVMDGSSHSAGGQASSQKAGEPSGSDPSKKASVSFENNTTSKIPLETDRSRAVISEHRPSYMLSNLWTAVGGAADVLVDHSDSQSCSSYSSYTTENSASASSLAATKGASDLETPIADELDRLIGTKDWDGVNAVAKKVESDAMNDYTPSESLQEKRQKKRELEAWRASVSKTSY